MFMAMLKRLFKRGQSTVDRNIELQDMKAEIDVMPAPEIMAPAAASPKVVYFCGRSDLIDRGYCSGKFPRRLRKINVEPDVAAVPGGVRRVNRLIRRGYYRSLRHAA